MAKIQAVSLVLALLLAREASAFVYIRGGVFQYGERPVASALEHTGQTVTFVYNSDLTAYGGSITPDVSAAQFETAIKAAIAAWRTCLNGITINFGGTSSATLSANAVNVFTYDNRTTGEGNSIAAVGTLAVATSSTSSTTVYLGCDITVNGEATGTFSVNGESSSYDLVGILTHELGHCLGIDHPVSPPGATSTNNYLNSATMYPSVTAGDISPRTLSQDDIDAVECVYPKGGSLRAGASCGSYHGTNGNGALSGVITGGPQADRSTSCGTAASAVTGIPGLEDGNGCITGVFAADGVPRARPWFQSSLLIPLSVIFVGFLVRVRRRFN